VIQIDRAKFFAGVRNGPFTGKLTIKQVSGMDSILNAWEAQEQMTDLRFLAYMLGTTYLETDATMQPIAEYGKGKGRKYGVPTGPFNNVYYGRGYVQLTWLRNYIAASDYFGEDYVKYPDRVMREHDAAQIMLWGMRTGAFTGRKLSDYFTATKTDWINARRIINGTDKAVYIAELSKQFYADIVLAS